MCWSKYEERLHERAEREFEREVEALRREAERREHEQVREPQKVHERKDELVRA